MPKDYRSMQTYEEHKVVSQKDLDDLEHVNNVRYVEWVNQIAENHWRSKTPSSLNQDYFWVLVKHSIEYKGEAILGDVLRLTTYVKKSKGVKSVRMVEVYNETRDKLITSSETIWCFMSYQTKRPARIPENIISLFS